MPTINQATLRTFAADPAAFREECIVDCDGRAVRFGDVKEPRQRADFAAADPGWRQAIGLPPNGEPKRLCSTRPRGSSKTTDAAVSLTWAMAFCPNRATGIAASGDFDQCKILASAVQRLLDLNPWLTASVRDRDTGRRVPMLACQGGKIRNARTGSETIILSADAATSYGHLADWIVIDEITNWPDSGERLWISLASTIAKRSRAMATMIQNAGFSISWQRRIFDAILTDPRWNVSHWDSPPAWMSAELLDEQRRLLPPGAFQRLYLNVWQDGSGDALPPETVRSAVRLAGPGMRTPEGDGVAVIGVDLATRRDSAAVTVLEADWRHRRVRVLLSEAWRPPTGGTIDLIAFRDRVAKLADDYCAVICYDPHQAVLMAQEWMADGHKCHEVAFTPTTLSAMASVALQAFREGKIDLYDDEEMVSDLLKLSIQERNYGFRIVAPRDGRGHCDKATSLLIALPGAWLVATEYQPEPEYPFAAGGVVNLSGETSLWR